MDFLARKKKNPPSVIIVALIDVLIVVLIFLLVTTTFKHQPAIKLTLPESSKPAAGASAGDIRATILTIGKDGKFYIGADNQPIPGKELPGRLKGLVAKQPDIHISIAPDTDAPVGSLVTALEAVNGSGAKMKVEMMTRSKDAK